MWYQFKRVRADGRTELCYTKDRNYALMYDSNPLPCEDYRGSIEQGVLGFCLGAVLITAGLLFIGPDLIAQFITHNEKIIVGAIGALFALSVYSLLTKDEPHRED